MKNKFNETDTDCGKIYSTVPKSPHNFSAAKELPAKLRYDLSKIDWKDPSVIKNLEAIVASKPKRLKENQITFNIANSITEYSNLIEAIKLKIKEPAMIPIVLHEIREDMRALNTNQKTHHISSEASFSKYLKSSILKEPCCKAPQSILTKDQISKLIDDISNSMKIAEPFKTSIRIP